MTHDPICSACSGLGDLVVSADDETGEWIWTECQNCRGTGVDDYQQLEGHDMSVLTNKEYSVGFYGETETATILAPSMRQAARICEAVWGDQWECVFNEYDGTTRAEQVGECGSVPGYE